MNRPSDKRSESDCLNPVDRQRKLLGYPIMFVDRTPQRGDTRDVILTNERRPSANGTERPNR